MNTVSVKDVTINSCNLCAPLGAALAFKGIRRSMLLLHGSQGCATYIRRYLIAHFREPVDIASSSFSENTAVFGGESQLKRSLDNIISQYEPEVIGVATTCLSETIGDDVPRFLKDYIKERQGMKLPLIIPVSTAAYSGNHSRGFFKSQRAVVANLARPQLKRDRVNLFTNLISPEDIRHLKDLCECFGLGYTLFPDYSDTLDGGAWQNYHRLPPGGTPAEELQQSPGAKASLEFSTCLEDSDSPGAFLEKNWGVPRYSLPLPVGVTGTDSFLHILEEQSGLPAPDYLLAERNRLLDSYADAHKYVFGKKVVIVGTEDLVYALASFASEIGMIPAVCASGGTSDQLAPQLTKLAEEYGYDVPEIRMDTDYASLGEEIQDQDLDLIIGNSKAYKMSRTCHIPLLRMGFPVHDRFGAAAKLSLGYLGSRNLLNEIVNTIISLRQESNPIGYTYQ